MAGQSWRELLDFPYDFEFKAFGPAGEEFAESVRDAVSATVPVSLDALRTRASAAGNHVCVTVVVRTYTPDQIEAIYRDLSLLPGLRYLL